jgi:hypothetical protein
MIYQYQQAILQPGESHDCDPLRPEEEEQCDPFAGENEQENGLRQPTQNSDLAIVTPLEQKQGGICEKCARHRKTLYRHGTGEYASYWCGTCLAREAWRINTREMSGRGRHGY